VNICATASWSRSAGTDDREEVDVVRFCMVTTFYPPYHFGGNAVFVRSLARALVSQGHEVEVVHCENAYRLKNDLPTADGESAEIVECCVRSGVMASKGIGDLVEEFSRLPGYDLVVLGDGYERYYSQTRYVECYLGLIGAIAGKKLRSTNVRSSAS
jgi:hypothetical protein